MPAGLYNLFTHPASFLFKQIYQNCKNDHFQQLCDYQYFLELACLNSYKSMYYVYQNNIYDISCLSNDIDYLYYINQAIKSNYTNLANWLLFITDTKQSIRSFRRHYRRKDYLFKKCHQCPIINRNNFTSNSTTSKSIFHSFSNWSQLIHTIR
jgi:hypothetical protein